MGSCRVILWRNTQTLSWMQYLRSLSQRKKKLPLLGNIFGFSKENKQKEDNKKWFLQSKVIPPFIYLWTKQDSNITKVIPLTGAYSVNVLGVSLITIFNEGAFLMSFPLAINKHTNLSQRSKDQHTNKKKEATWNCTTDHVMTMWTNLTCPQVKVYTKTTSK